MRILVGTITILLVACQTQFTGSPHIEPAACQAKCSAVQMQMTGMIYMGEYSSACICERAPAASAPVPAASHGGAGGVSGAAAGVVMQMRRAAQQQRQSGY